MRIQLGYPDALSERELLKNNGGRARSHQVEACIDATTLSQLQQAVESIHVADAVLDYIQALLRFSRQHTQAVAGLSTRAGLALKQAAQAWALIEGRDFVLPEDIQAVFKSVAEHRLQRTQASESSISLAHHILENVAVA